MARLCRIVGHRYRTRWGLNTGIGAPFLVLGCTRCPAWKKKPRNGA